jgi:hypothetical protein
MVKGSKTQDAINIDIIVKSTKDIFQQSGLYTLNREFEEYIFSSVRNYPIDKRVKAVIYVSKDIDEAESVMHAINKHFARKAIEYNHQLRQQLSQWIGNMIIGILFLVLCLILVQILDVFSHINIIKIVKESLLIIGWVALWEPVSFLLFGWRAIKRDKLICGKLSTIPVSIIHLK